MDVGALACAGEQATTALLERRGAFLAVYGHPRWSRGPERSASLAETCTRLIDAYREEGGDALRSLFGDFAIAIVEPHRERGLIAIDRTGTRSIVYQQTKAQLLFASTADVLACHPLADATIEPQAIFNYVYFHMIPGPSTAIRNQARVLPGHYLQWDGSQLNQRPYWKMDFKEEDGDVASYREALRAALREGVKATLANGRSGAFLSGGTDSSTVSGLIGEITGEPAQTFSIGFDAQGYDEMEFARIAAQHFGTEHHEYYVTPADVAAAVPRIAEVYDQPFGNASAIPTYYCARLATQHNITRILGGDGGDELFGGNARYAKQHQLAHYQRIPRALRSGLVEPIVKRLPVGTSIPLVRKAWSYVQQASLPMPQRYESYNLLNRLGVENVFSPEFLRSVNVDGPSQVLADAFAPYGNCSLINQMLGIDLKLTLADNDLPKVTRTCELAGIDVAFPMLEDEVVSFSARLPRDLKLKGAHLRYFFKEALRGFLPDAIIEKRKHGFGLPAGEWLRSNPQLNEIARDALHSLKKRGIVRPAFVDALLGQYLPRHPSYYGTMVWVLMMLELWLRKRSAS
jgi:asparagine synthase (glutamine-hydrolysing)